MGGHTNSLDSACGHIKAFGRLDSHIKGNLY